jgi:hypothetical protein
MKFSGITWGFCEVAKYLGWLSVLLLVLSKDDSKILFLFLQIQNFEVLNLEMAKGQKVNIPVTYILIDILA